MKYFESLVEIPVLEPVSIGVNKFCHGNQCNFVGTATVLVARATGCYHLLRDVGHAHQSS